MNMATYGRDPLAVKLEDIVADVIPIYAELQATKSITDSDVSWICEKFDIEGLTYLYGRGRMLGELSNILNSMWPSQITCCRAINCIIGYVWNLEC